MENWRITDPEIFVIPDSTLFGGAEGQDIDFPIPKQIPEENSPQINPDEKDGS